MPKPKPKLKVETKQRLKPKPKLKVETKQRHVLHVSYPLNYYAWGSLDTPLEKAVRKGCDGGGTGFGMRDLDWSFKQRPSAKAALQRVQALRLKGLKLSLAVYDDD